MSANPVNTQPKIGINVLASLRVMNEEGEKVTLSPIWKEQSVVLIFIRQFSCIACRAHVDQVWKKREQFEASKTKIIFIGTGAPYMIKMFKEDLNIQEAIVYTDPTLKYFDACGLRRNPIRLLDPRGISKIKGLIDKDYTQNNYSSDSGNYTQGLLPLSHQVKSSIISFPTTLETLTIRMTGQSNSIRFF